jgi:hypothetical protein
MEYINIIYMKSKYIKNIIVAIIVLIVIFNISVIYLCRYSIPSDNLKNKVLWVSDPEYFNHSMTNGVIAIRHDKLVRNNMINLIKCLFTQSKSTLWIFSGDNFENKKNLNLPYEDPRMFYYNNKYYIIGPRPVFSSEFGIVTGVEIRPNLVILNNDLEIESHKEFDFTEFKKPVMQKNWNLFTDVNNNLYCFTDVYPIMKIRKIDLNTPKLYGGFQHDMTSFFPKFKGYLRCSTAFIPWKNNTMICGLHFKRDFVVIRSLFFVVKDKYPFEPVAYSKTYSFFNQENCIEFLTSINWNKDKTKIICCVGNVDYNSYNLEVDPSDIEFIN